MYTCIISAFPAFTLQVFVSQWAVLLRFQSSDAHVVIIRALEIDFGFAAYLMILAADPLYLHTVKPAI